MNEDESMTWVGFAYKHDLLAYRLRHTIAISFIFEHMNLLGTYQYSLIQLHSLSLRSTLVCTCYGL